MMLQKEKERERDRRTERGKESADGSRTKMAEKKQREQVKHEVIIDLTLDDDDEEDNDKEVALTTSLPAPPGIPAGEMGVGAGVASSSASSGSTSGLRSASTSTAVAPTPSSVSTSSIKIEMGTQMSALSSPSSAQTQVHPSTDADVDSGPGPGPEQALLTSTSTPIYDSDSNALIKQETLTPNTNTTVTKPPNPNVNTNHDTDNNQNVIKIAENLLAFLGGGTVSSEESIYTPAPSFGLGVGVSGAEGDVRREEEEEERTPKQQGVALPSLSEARPGSEGRKENEAQSQKMPVSATSWPLYIDPAPTFTTASAPIRAPAPNPINGDGGPAQIKGEIFFYSAFLHSFLPIHLSMYSFHVLTLTVMPSYLQSLHHHPPPLSLPRYPPPIVATAVTRGPDPEPRAHIVSGIGIGSRFRGLEESGRAVNLGRCALLPLIKRRARP
jgi:hypothetical protein